MRNEQDTHKIHTLVLSYCVDFCLKKLREGTVKATQLRLVLVLHNDDDDDKNASNTVCPQATGVKGHFKQSLNELYTHSLPACGRESGRR